MQDTKATYFYFSSSPKKKILKLVKECTILQRKHNNNNNSDTHCIKFTYGDTTVTSNKVNSWQTCIDEQPANTYLGQCYVQSRRQSLKTCEFASSYDNAVCVLSSTQQLLAINSMNEFTPDDEQSWKAKWTPATGPSSNSQECIYLQLASIHRTHSPWVSPQYLQTPQHRPMCDPASAAAK